MLNEVLSAQLTFLERPPCYFHRNPNGLMGKQNCKIGGRGEWESLNYVLKSRGKRGIYAKKRDNHFRIEKVPEKRWSKELLDFI